MSFKLMICRECNNMFRIDVADYERKGIECPKCKSKHCTGIYEYWGTLSSPKEGFAKTKVSE